MYSRMAGTGWASASVGHQRRAARRVPSSSGIHTGSTRWIGRGNAATVVTPRDYTGLSACGGRRMVEPRDTGPRRCSLTHPDQEAAMAKKGAGEGVYRVIDVIGTSKRSWEDATKNAVETATRSLRDLRIAEVQKLDVKIDGGKIVAYRARVQVSFKYER